MQANPNALSAFTPNPAYSDPTFDNCFITQCTKTWGLRIFNSTNIHVYGAGLYSFFDNYNSACLQTADCQQNMVNIEQSEAVYLYVLNTVGSSNIVLVDDVALVPQPPNANLFTDTLVVFEYP